MPRTIFTLVLFSTSLLVAPPADAFWGRWGGWGGWGVGWSGGWGWGGWCPGGCACGGWGPGGCSCGFAGAGFCGGAYGPWGASPFIRPYVTVMPAYPGLIAVPSIRPQMPVVPSSALPTLTNADLARVLSRVANVEARRKAERSLVEGDELFREQNYHSALQRYKLAASTAPDLAEAHWRKGHALVATHNYDLAITAFKRAMELQPATKRGFRLDDIYGPAGMTKTLHFESLAEWALERTESSDAWFLVGVTLYFDGQQPRAQKFFARSAALDPSAARNLAAFALPPPAPPDAAPAIVAPDRLAIVATEL